MNPYVFTAEEQAELNEIIESLRGSADELERLVTIRDSNYISGMTHHLQTILDGYRKVLTKRERALYHLNVKFYERRLNK